MKFLLLVLFAFTLVGFTGCRAFRELFDEPPAEEPSLQQTENTQTNFEDPVAKLLTIKRSKPAPLTVTSYLSEEEKALVEAELAPIQERQEEKALRDRMKKDSETYENWVFGGNPLKKNQKK